MSSLGACASMLRLVVAAVCLGRAGAKFVRLGGGACLTVNGDEGTFEAITALVREKCQIACLVRESCVAFEFDAGLQQENCELHTEEITQVDNLDDQVECFRKEFVPFFESKAVHLAVMIAGVFAMQVAFLIKALLEKVSHWSASQARRRQKRACNGVRILFDKNGRIVKDDDDGKHVKQLERIIGVLRTLAGGLAFGNLRLFKCHKSILNALEVAERCAPQVRLALVSGDGGAPLNEAFDKAEGVLVDLLERRPPRADVTEALNNLKCELAVLYAVHADNEAWLMSTAVETALLGSTGWGWRAPARFRAVPEFPSNPIPGLAWKARMLRRSSTAQSRMQQRADFMEPQGHIEGVELRRSRCLAWAVDLREQLGIGSRRLGLATVVFLAALGPVRFLGLVPAVFLTVVLLGQLVLELRRACELRGGGHLRRNFARASVPMALLVVVVIFLLVSGLEPCDSNAEIERRFTFLPVPPQYALETITGQQVYVSLIFGIMHANLALLCLLPLPVSYGVQALLVRFWPRLRFLVPQCQVWLHRTMGFMLLGGLSATGMVWLIFQGRECFGNENIQSCEAFEPQLAAGIDVYVLRFHIVWPFMFFFIPLMIWAKYPESWEGAVHARPSSAAASKGGSGEAAAKSLEDGKRAAAAPKPAAVGGREAPREGLAAALGGFLYRRLVEVVPIIVALAGCHHVILQNFDIFFPFWFFVIVPLALHALLKLRSFAASLLGERCLLRKSDEMSEFLRRSWWETAYSSHVVAFSIMAFFALFYRIEVFFPMFLTWGAYFLDKCLFLYRAYAHPMPIVVGEGVSSYVVNCGEGSKAEPSHVRLVLRKPPGFRYRAGQWCQLAMPDCGRYWGSPGAFLPFMQWHAFSIASKESDDYLEFHVGVHALRGAAFGERGRLSLAKAEGEASVRFSRRGWLLDWFCPHRVPHPASGATVKGEFTAEPTGMYLNLQPAGDTSASGVKTLKPQMQWTGRLWNAVQCLLEENGRQEAIRRKRLVYISGPYGTLPWTVAEHRAAMLIGAGVGYPSTGAMLRQLLEDNLTLPPEEQKPVCFIWTASKLDQLLLCFPSLLVDLTKYVHAKDGAFSSGIEDLKRWLHIKIFISNFEAGEFLSCNPGKALFPESGRMSGALDKVRQWLLGRDVVQDGPKGQTIDADGTYIAQGSLGASFAGILQRSLFTRGLVDRGLSLGISYCGPPDLCSLLRTDVANTILPVKVEFAAEAAA